MTDLTDVLHRATDGLSPEAPDLLLERAVRRGAGLRRRRHARVATTAVCGLAAVGVLAVALLGRPAPDSQSTPVGPGPTASSSATTAPDPQVTVDRGDVGATFAAVLPGAITREHDVPADRVHEKGGYESSFEWDGFPVSVAMWPYPGSARAGCADAVGDPGSEQLCVRVRGGWAVHDRTMGDTDYNRWVSVFLDNGFRVWVMITNGPGKGSATGGPPPLGVPDLERVATSDLWFR
jgi:hypothetical protein